MDIRKFIKRDRNLFKWSEVEERACIPSSSLRSFISGRRELSEDVFKSVRDFFIGYGIELEYTRPKDVKVRKRSIKVGDIVSREGWVKTLGSNVKNGKMRGVYCSGGVRVTAT